MKSPTYIDEYWQSYKYFEPIADQIRNVDGVLLENIRITTNKGLALGCDRFKEDVENLTGRRVVAQKMGRSVGWRKDK